MDADMKISNVLDLAAHRASWLAKRENLVAENVANSNTPGYKTADLTPFEVALDSARLPLTRTSPRHMAVEASVGEPKTNDDFDAKTEVYLAGNDVNIEKEMIKGGEVTRAYSLNSAVTKSFHSMIMASAKA
jgi:flagellar basal-body rod protein FlgB